MLRAVSNICFVFTWVLVIAGAVMYHVVVARVLPPLTDLPVNLATGFDDVFRFSYMQQDAANVTASAARALGKCGVVASSACAGNAPLSVNGSSDTRAERESIVAALQNSLSTIGRVAGDRYFGTPPLQGVAQEIGNITAGVAQLSGATDCAQSSAVYCDIYRAATALDSRVSGVQAEIETFKGSKDADNFEDFSRYFHLLHVLPYFLVIAMIFFSCFWGQGAICCGTEASRFSCFWGRFACFTLIPFAVFWLASFVLTVAVVVGRGAVKSDAAEARINYLQGDPTVAEVLEHLEAKFPEFWSYVFANLVSGLTAWVGASAVLLAINAFVMAYAVCLCCAQPYRKSGLVES